MSQLDKDRARIEAAAVGRTACQQFQETAEANASLPALSIKEGDAWRTLTWADYRQQVMEVATGLIGLGVEHGDYIALLLKNRPEHVIADVAALHSGGVPCSLYYTLQPEQLAYILSNCGAKVIVVDDAESHARIEGIRDQLPALEHVIVVNDAEKLSDVTSWEELRRQGRTQLAEDGGGAFENAWRAVNPDDPVTLIYTSGTTGHPKGVVLTHHNLMWLAESLTDLVTFDANPRLISYLPLAHIAERAFSHYTAVRYGAHVHFSPEIEGMLETVQKARPYAFLGVPRVWEKVQAALTAGVQAEEDERRRKLALKALEVGQEVVRIKQRGDAVPLKLKAQHALFEKLVFSKIREKIGLDQCRIPVSGAAPISEGALTFFAGIGLEICEAYGMTETTAVLSFNPPGQQRIGTVGKVLPGIELRIADDGEVIARGPSMTPGYLKRPEATAELLDEDGWLHTGDLGSLSDDGYLKIIGRKKELIITAGGKNISPNNIEELIKQQHPLIGQVLAVGDNRPFIGALVVLDPEAAPVWAAQVGIDSGSLAELSQHPKVLEQVQTAIDAANQHLARVEQVKQWTLLPTEWTPESDELTPTMKLRRSVIHDKYSDAIDALYTG